MIPLPRPLWSGATTQHSTVPVPVYREERTAYQPTSLSTHGQNALFVFLSMFLSSACCWYLVVGSWQLVSEQQRQCWLRWYIWQLSRPSYLKSTNHNKGGVNKYNFTPPSQRLEAVQFPLHDFFTSLNKLKVLKLLKLLKLLSTVFQNIGPTPSPILSTALYFPHLIFRTA